jgi:O-antigen/teichoic acid export membrane protein
MLRFLPEYEDESGRRTWVLSLAYLTSIFTSLVTAFLLYVSAPLVTSLTIGDPLLTDTLRVLALVLPFNTLSDLTSSVFRSIEQTQYRIAIEYVVEPLVRMVAIGIALLLGYSLIGVVGTIAAGGVLIFIVSVALLLSRTELRPKIIVPTKDTKELKTYYNFTIPVAFKDVGSFLYNRVDILMLGIFLTGASIGIYKIAIVVSTLLVIPIRSFKELFPPIAARLYSNDKVDQLDSIYETVTRWMFTMTLFPGSVMIVYQVEILDIFGEEFGAGAAILTVFVFGQLMNSIAGPSGIILMMTDNQYFNLANQWGFGILNAILNYVLIVEFGLIGAAIATGAVLTGINLLRVFEVWYLEELWPYSPAYWKPIFAAGSSAVVMWGVGTILSGYVLLVVGAITGAGAFLGLLFVLGIEESDKQLFNELRTEWSDSA